MATVDAIPRPISAARFANSERCRGVGAVPLAACCCVVERRERCEDGNRCRRWVSARMERKFGGAVLHRRRGGCHAHDVAVADFVGRV